MVTNLPLSAKGTLQKYHLTSPPSDGLLVCARYFCLALECSITSSNLAIFEGVFFSKSGEVSSTTRLVSSDSAITAGSEGIDIENIKWVCSEWTCNAENLKDQCVNQEKNCVNWRKLQDLPSGLAQLQKQGFSMEWKVEKENQRSKKAFENLTAILLCT